MSKSANRLASRDIGRILGVKPMFAHNFSVVEDTCGCCNDVVIDILWSDSAIENEIKIQNCMNTSCQSMIPCKSITMSFNEFSSHFDTFDQL